MMKTTQTIHLHWNGRDRNIEYQWVGVQDSAAPLMIFLHEGLGSVAHWQHWPEQLCQVLGYRGLVYSRYAYGNSSPRPSDEIWQGDYLHIEAQQALPALLQALSIDQPFSLFGHSDGGTIALLYAAQPNNLAQDLIVLAPHIYIEAQSTQSVQKAIHWYQHGDLKQRLARYHADVDSAFWGWATVWGDESYQKTWNIERDIQTIRCPILAIQGTEDEYASLDQIHIIQRHLPQQTTLCVLEHCRHTPYIDAPEAVTKAVQDFLAERRCRTS